jgi:polysaccharide export outer membrane protein
VRKVLTAFLAGLLIQSLFLQSAFAQTRPATQPVSVPVTVPGPAYRINPGDEILVSVWGDERLNRSVRILPDGTFAFPLVGQIVAAGQLPADLERIIRAALQPQYRGAVPQVTVSVTNPSGYQFSVAGKVNSPGTFTPGRYVNALEALIMAGGPSQFASLGNAVILRKRGTQIISVRVRLNDAIRGDARNLTEADIPFIQSGDTLVVP